MEPFRGVYDDKHNPVVGIVAAMQRAVKGRALLEDAKVDMTGCEHLVDRAQMTLEEAQKAQRLYVKRLAKAGKASAAASAKANGVDANGLTADEAAAITM